MDRKQQQIAQLPLFSGCTKKEIAWVAARADTLDIPAGTTLAIEGKRVREFIVLMDGEAVADGERLRAGSFFGHIGLVDQMAHDRTVVTSSTVRALVFGARVFTGLLAECPNVSRHLMRDLVTEIRSADREVASLQARVAW